MTPTTGRRIAFAAVLVQAPRLILALLAADREPVGLEWQRGLLVVAGLGTAVVLTGGNLYLAHALATARRWRAMLTAVWVAVLASSGALLVPMIAAGLSGRTLPQVLGSSDLQWSWAVLAAMAHEVTAAGCMLASAASAPGSQQLSQLSPLPQPLELAGSPLVPAEGQAEQAHSCPESCGRSFRSAAAAAGHLRHCPLRLNRPRETARPSSIQVSGEAQ
jgi:MFS family permease